MKIGFCCVACMLVAASVHADGQVLYEQGTACFSSNPAKALDLFVQAADEGYVSAMAGAGHCFEKGIGTPVAYAKAIAWYEKAVAQNALPACEGLARIYASCPDPEFHNGEKAVRYASAAARKKPSDANALALLASAYARNMNFAEAMKVQSMAAKKAGLADLERHKELIDAYEAGTPFPAQASQEWIEGAAEQGSAWAMIQLAASHGEDSSLPDQEKARFWYDRAAASGSSFGALMAGKYAWNGYGGSIDKNAALRHFTNAAKGGLEEALFWAGYAYCCIGAGKGDLDNALNYFQRMDIGQDQLAKAFLLKLQNSNWRSGIPKQSVEELYSAGRMWESDRIVADQNDPTGQHVQTLEADKLESLIYYLIAAEKGHKLAAKKVYDLFNDGAEQVEPDPDRAQIWAHRLKLMGVKVKGSVPNGTKLSP